MEIRRSDDRLISTMGFPMLVDDIFLLNQGPGHNELRYTSKTMYTSTKLKTWCMHRSMPNRGSMIVMIPYQWNITPLQAPVPLCIFRSNSKFDENSKHSSVKYKWLITTIFCTRHDSVTVLTCAKYLCDRSGIFKTRAFWIFIEFRIRSKYA